MANMNLRIMNPGQDARFASAASAFADRLALPLSEGAQYVLFPGFCDVHVHFREPGFSYKETMATGSAAAAHGGYTAVCAMPNLNPVPDSVDHLQAELEAIEKGSCIHVYPYGSISVGEMGETLADLEGMAERVIAFSDDGHGVQDPVLMKEAMRRAKDLGKLIVAHCEDNSLLHGGYIHDGAYAKLHGHRGISSASEYAQIARDLELAAETGCAYHVCHISTKESVEVIRQAKASGVNVTCETGPHYLILDDSCIQENGRFKMNPPLRSPEDREAMVEGLLDGTIDVIATDHAPHSAEEKSRGLEKSAMGVVGIETAFSLMYTHFVKKDILSLERLVELLTTAPRSRFDIPWDNDFTLWDLNEQHVIDPADFLSKGRATPFEGMTVSGKCLLTICNGKEVYRA